MKSSYLPVVRYKHRLLSCYARHNTPSFSTAIRIPPGRSLAHLALALSRIPGKSVPVLDVLVIYIFCVFNHFISFNKVKKLSKNRE